MADGLRVALNALFLDPGVSGGPETYLRGLVPALAARHPATRLTVVTTGRGAAALRSDGWEDWCELVRMPCEDGQKLRRASAEQVLFPWVARRRRCHLIHSLASVAPLWPGRAAVITVHDVTFMRVATFGRLTTFGMTQMVARPATRAEALIAMSAAARDEIAQVLGIERERFTVIPHGAGREPAARATDAAILRRSLKLTDGQRVVACVGAKRPHKNQALLLRALPYLDEEVVLVLVGHGEAYERDLRALAQQLGLGERVRFADYLPDSDLEGLYSLADCLAFPTLGEGFGLPVVEAMRRGLPVACSDLPVLREVAGEAAVYFPPDDPAAAAAAIVEAFTEPGLARAGAERARRFSWEAAADATHAVYERVAGAA